MEEQAKLENTPEKVEINDKMDEQMVQTSSPKRL
jgi:hypothetical protein